MRTFFRLYMRALTLIGAIYPMQHAMPALVEAPPVPSPTERNFFEADQAASTYGEIYRGAGICMVVLGALIVLCAVAPLALESDHASVRWWGLGEVALMVTVIAILVWLKHRNIRGLWVSARLQAEQGRYRELASKIDALESSLAAQQDGNQPAQSLAQELQSTLASQIAYNQSKHSHYEQIESGASLVGAVIFGLAFLAAVTHLLVHWPWLLFFTAVGPMLAGALHGINGFLRLCDLSDGHRETAQRLSQLQDQFNRLAGLDIAPGRLLNLGRDVYAVLVTRDVKWQHMAQSLNPKLG